MFTSKKKEKIEYLYFVYRPVFNLFIGRYFDKHLNIDFFKLSLNIESPGLTMVW